MLIYLSMLIGGVVCVCKCLKSSWQQVACLPEGGQLLETCWRTAVVPVCDSSSLTECKQHLPAGKWFSVMTEYRVSIHHAYGAVWSRTPVKLAHMLCIYVAVALQAV
jgi:hypothetical protein